MEVPMFHDSYNDEHVFTEIGSGGRPSRTTRSWTANGVHYTVDATSYSSPGLSFGTMTGSAGTPFGTPRTSARSVGGGLLGGAVGLLEGFLSMQQSHRRDPRHDHTGQSSSNTRRVTIEEPDDDDEDLLYEQYESDRSRPKSVFTRIKDRILDGQPGNQQPSSYNFNQSRSREQSRDRSPNRRPRAERRHGSYRTERREPPWTERRRSQPEYIEVDYDDVFEDIEPKFRDDRPGRASPPDQEMVQALAAAVESERRAVRTCKKRLESASRQVGTSSYHLQQLLNQLKSHEDALISAQAHLDEATARKRRHKSSRQSSYQARSREHIPKAQPSAVFEEDFVDPFAGLGGSFFATSGSRHPDPLFQAFQDFNSFSPFTRAGFGIHEPLFEQLRQSSSGSQFRFYTTSTGPQPSSQGTKRSRHSVPQPGPQSTPSFPTFSTAPAPKQPPPNMLKPGEARALFQTYNQQWNAMSSTDDKIPYPSRGFAPDALLMRDTIWAPLCRADVGTWSNETIMQANAQAFYLGVVGLTPVYKEAPGTGSIEMSFDKSKATSQQVDELVSILKKEKTRWHSDRLGRRNSGSGSPNEALQKDERARAVFHAVCGLMESAQ